MKTLYRLWLGEITGWFRSVFARVRRQYWQWRRMRALRRMTRDMRRLVRAFNEGMVPAIREGTRAFSALAALARHGKDV